MMSRYGKYFTKKSLARQPSAIRALMPLLKRPGTISLGGGMPNTGTFNVSGLKVSFTDGSTRDVGDIGKVLQYSETAGLPKLVSILQDIQKKYHDTPAESSSVMVSTGSQDALTKCFELVLDEDDSLLLEEFTYSGSLAFLKPLGCNLVPIKTDQDGILPGDLDQVLTNWDSALKKPKVLYTIPTGANPTGTSISTERRQALYDVASKHDLLILEDDPYYFLQYGEQRYPSLYSIDKDSRVVRFDSFSKILSSGLRLGFVTGPTEIIDRLVLHMQSTSLHTSGFSQGVALTIFEHWNGLDGFEQHVQQVSKFYRKQRDLFVSLVEKHLTGLCTWRVPEAGMFLWVRIHDDVPSVKEFSKSLVEDDRVLVVSGDNFHPHGQDIPYVRLSFSTSSEQDMDEALARIKDRISTIVKSS